LHSINNLNLKHMAKSIEQHAQDFERNPMGCIFKALLIIILIGGLLGTVGYFAGWFSEAATVTKKEFGPQAMLKKYEWFKNASAELVKKENDILVYSTNLKNMEDSYKNIPRNKWDRTDKEQYNQWSIELAGIKASYNSVAAEYNAQSSKFNWSPFKGNSDLPPTEYKTFINQ